MMTEECASESKERPKVDLDTVLEEIGRFGKYHIKITVQCVIACLFTSWNINEFVFTAARIKTRCLIPGCDDPSQTEFTPPWITNVVPSTDGSLDNCHRFGNISALFSVNYTCPASQFNTSVLQKCEEYLYENTNTVVWDFELACDEWRRALIGSVRIFGMMVALGITGYISDRWGRRRALALNTSLAALLGIWRYWAPSYQVYVLLLFLESVASCGTFSCTYVLMVELLGPKYRVMGGAIMNTTFSVGQVTLSFIAWVIPDWRRLIVILYVPQFLCILYFWTPMESVRWLLSKGRFKEGEIFLEKAARENGKQLSEKSLEGLRNNMEKKIRKDSEKKEKPMLMLLVLRDRRILTRCFVTSVCYITGTLVYYGLSINALNLTGNGYLNYVVVSLIEIPGFWSVPLLIDKIGRKPTLTTAYWLCAACQIGFIFISNDRVVLSLVVYMLGKFSISVVLTTLNIFTLELFPTEYRHRLFSFSFLVGRVGSIVAPLTPAFASTLFAELPFVLFGGMALLAGLLTFLVPDTRGSRLADTMEEALSIEKTSKNKSIKT